MAEAIALILNLGNGVFFSKRVEGMTIEQLEKYQYWADENGNIWQRESYCTEPTATFVRLTAPGPSYDKGHPVKGGGIHSPLLSNLKPIELPAFDLVEVER